MFVDEATRMKALLLLDFCDSCDAGRVFECELDSVFLE
jgi:hypothetical protein